ncbi:MAG: hypothetical protein ABJ308_00320 [Halieaceae bacterium]
MNTRLATTYVTAAIQVLMVMVMGLIAPQVAAEENLNLLPQTEVFRFNTQDKFYETRRYSKKFKIKGIEVSEQVYFGEARVAGRKGPGFTFEGQGYSWGFNHRGAELLIKF